MTSPDADPFLSATPEDVEDDLRRAFLGACLTGRSGTPRRLVTEFPAEATETAMSRVGPVLEAKDAEIARLREQQSPITITVRDIPVSEFPSVVTKIADDVMAKYAPEFESRIRADELKRIADQVTSPASYLVGLICGMRKVAGAHDDDWQRWIACLNEVASELCTIALLPESVDELEAGASAPAVDTEGTEA